MKKIVDEHGGMIIAENTRDGACVVIRLPLETSVLKTNLENGVMCDSVMHSQFNSGDMAQRGEIA